MSENSFFSWRHAVIKSSLHSTTKHVLLTLSCYFNDVGTGAFPSIATLCGDTSLSNRAVITHLQLAISDGWITSFKHGMAGQKWKRNEYQIAWPEGGEGRSLPSGKVVNVVPEGGERSDVKVVKDVHTNSSLNSSLISPINTPPSGFEMFWKEYPKKVERIAAKKAWLQIPSVEAHVPEILEGLSRWKAVWTDPQFIPYPDKFLRRRKWEDEVPVNGNAISKNDQRIRSTIETTRRALARARSEGSGQVCHPPSLRDH